MFVNFSGFKRHLGTRRGQLLLGAFIVALGVSFLGGGKGEPPFVAPIRALAAAPLATLADLAQVSPELLRERLAAAGLQPASDMQSLTELTGPACAGGYTRWKRGSPRRADAVGAAGR